MTDVPIIFSAPMVRAWLAGRKTMTRRLAWGEPFAIDLGDYEPRTTWKTIERKDDTPLFAKATLWQRVQPGDRLWVREAIGRRPFGGYATNGAEEIYYAADGDEGESITEEAGFDIAPWWNNKGKLTPIHMPRWVSRLTLVVTATKVEPLQEISEADAMAEGTQLSETIRGRQVWHASHRAAFAALWTNLHGAESWQVNPEVVALTCRVIKQNIDKLPKENAA